MNGVEINTRAYVATRLLLRWDYLYAVTLKTKVFGDYNHARLEVSWITSTRGLLLRGYTGLEHGRCKQSIFSLSIFGILVERLSFQRPHFCSDFVTVFFIFFVYARATILCYRFFNFDLRKKLCFVKADRVG